MFYYSSVRKFCLEYFTYYSYIIGYVQTKWWIISSRKHTQTHKHTHIHTHTHTHTHTCGYVWHGGNSHMHAMPVFSSHHFAASEHWTWLWSYWWPVDNQSHFNGNYPRMYIVGQEVDPRLSNKIYRDLSVIVVRSEEAPIYNL